METVTVKRGGGRPKGQHNYRNYRWKVIMFRDGEFVEGKFSSIREMNSVLHTNWNTDFCNRLWSKKGVDDTGKMKEMAFINKYAHIKLQKIHELRDVPGVSKTPVPIEN